MWQATLPTEPSHWLPLAFYFGAVFQHRAQCALELTRGFNDLNLQVCAKMPNTAVLFSNYLVLGASSLCNISTSQGDAHG